MAIAREHAWDCAKDTKNAIVMVTGPVARGARRCRLRCASLVCDSSGPKPECHCFEAPAVMCTRTRPSAARAATLPT